MTKARKRERKTGTRLARPRKRNCSASGWCEGASCGSVEGRRESRESSGAPESSARASRQACAHTADDRHLTREARDRAAAVASTGGCFLDGAEAVREIGAGEGEKVGGVRSVHRERRKGRRRRARGMTERVSGTKRVGATRR